MRKNTTLTGREMSKPDPDQQFFGKCRSCGAIFSATERADGTIKPNGVGSNCACGKADFYQIPSVQRD